MLITSKMIINKICCFIVMLMGTLVYGIRYSFQEYLCSLLVAGGVSIFALAKVNMFLTQDLVKMCVSDKN